jgi:hypothetical protein
MSNTQPAKAVTVVIVYLRFQLVEELIATGNKFFQCVEATNGCNRLHFQLAWLYVNHCEFLFLKKGAIETGQ